MDQLGSQSRFFRCYYPVMVDRQFLSQVDWRKWAFGETQYSQWSRTPKTETGPRSRLKDGLLIN